MRAPGPRESVSLREDAPVDSVRWSHLRAIRTLCAKMTLSTPPHATARARRRATTKGATARISIALLALLPMSAGCRTTGCVAAKPVDPTLIGTIDELYAAFNFDAGEHPDWDVQRRIALPGATFVPSIRADRAPEGTDLDRFLADFEQFVETGPYRETGFHERIVGLHTEQFGGIAQVWVAFEGFVPGGEVETVGLDFLSLVHDGQDWRLASFTTQYADDSFPLPERFRTPPSE